MLASPSLALQVSAFEILHHHIPKTQEQVSLDKALENDFTAKLPEELTSLIVDAPSLDFFDEPKFEQIIPSVVNSYLLSWKLIFDHWTGSSYKVQADYTAILKNGNFLQNLLDFTVEILITMRTTPVNASLLEFESYTPNTSQSPENEIYTLLIHLYYLSLKYLPNLSKAWWHDKTSRQTVVAVEAWTEKYVSYSCSLKNLIAQSST